MTLSKYELSASIAVSDMAQARMFYEERLGLSPLRQGADGSRVYASGDGASLHVYESATNAGKATATLATWRVDDIERVVDELTSEGVTFERYEDPALKADEKGIHELDDGRVAWFKDPDGNTFAVEQ